MVNISSRIQARCTFEVSGFFVAHARQVRNFSSVKLQFARWKKNERKKKKREQRMVGWVTGEGNEIKTKFHRAARHLNVLRRGTGGRNPVFSRETYYPSWWKSPRKAGRGKSSIISTSMDYRRLSTGTIRLMNLLRVKFNPILRC